MLIYALHSDSDLDALGTMDLEELESRHGDLHREYETRFKNQ